MRYFGRYERFSLAPDAEVGRVMSADNAVGDIYDIRLELEDGEYTAWLVNRFDSTIGCFDHAFSRELALMDADGMIEKAILSFLAYTAGDEERIYWGEMAVICYDPAYEEEMTRYIQGISSRIADDVRPDIDLSDEAIERIVASDGEWLPSQTVRIPENGEDRAYVKRRQRMAEKLADQGRAGNKGCYIASWAVLIILVAAIILSVTTCMGL